MRVSIAASRRSRLGEAAALTGVDLDEGNAGRAKAALEGEMIGTGRLEDDALDRRLRGPLHERALCPHLSFAKRRLAPSARR
jgi:hypothetical protein